MRIKRVEIIGFKSFCDRAVINIDSEVTGVVGPNGCGKSNIVDAIRWTMGEQSAKHLRGKAMEDVIFAGSESRGPAPMAEVSITFDDVGFSHETLEMARHSDERSAEQQIDSLVPDREVEGDDEMTVEELAAEATNAEPAEGSWVDADGKAVASPQEQVADVLSDRAPAFEFSSYTEVTITRRLYRDGISQYFINKTPCRLRDITDFFLGTGVGTKAYAIIEQGRIGQIVSARPQDRRAIIEEAAGITKFKAKKKAAEKKLDQTRQNLMRVSDIVVELDKRMGTLRRQAQKAERYRKYKTELRDIDLWKATHRWLELHAEGKLVATRLAETASGLDDARTAWNAKDAHVVAERAELSLEERRLVGVQERVYELDNRLRLGESKIGFERREADELDVRIGTARSEIHGIATQRERGAEELAERTTELAALAAEVEGELAEVSARESAVADARTALTATQTSLDEARTEIASRRTEVATSDAQLEALARRREEAGRRLERVVAETHQYSDRVKELEREGRKVDHALVELRQTRLDLGSQTDGFGARREVLAEDVARGEAEVETLRTELHRRRSRLTSLEEIQQRYEGFQRGTRAVMQQASDISPSSIRGVVADVVRAPEQLEAAVEAVLGDRLGGVLVDEPEVGIAAIGFLKQSSGGRSAFVPLETRTAVPEAVTPNPSSRFEGEGGTASWMSPAWSEGASTAGKIEVDDRTQLVAAHIGAGAEGVLGRMSDLVAFAEGYEQVGKRLLAGAVVVDDLDRALKLHVQGVTDRLVTLDGDVVDEDGVVAGGSRDAQGAGVLAQKREIRDLGEIVGRLEHDLSEAMQRLVTARTELKHIVKALEGLVSQVHEGNVAIMGHEKDESRVRTELERHGERLNQLGNEQLELEHRIRAIEIDDSVARERKAHADERIALLDREQLELVSLTTLHRDHVEAIAATLTESRVRAAQLVAQRAAAETTALRLSMMDGDLAARAERLGHEIDEAATRATELRAGCEALELELDETRAQRETEVGELDRGRAAYEARLSALTEVELAARELRGQADRLQSELGQLELRNGQIGMTRQVVEDGVNERHQLAVTSILYDYHQRPHVTDVDEARLVELKDLIERMGTDINLTAIEEFDEVSKRFEFLSAQKNDLERAVDQLQRAIDKINKTSRKLFKDTFAAVNATFKEVFPRLFRGGQAALSLSGGEGVDLLEAGIEIMAQPPGKKNATVDQLSGGEKALTAVALVFSIFLIKPSPFCILDEVDAPLDEANVDRYNELVREMTDRSQFIVITHNKRTMECADNLYGVTMQEPGVSKLVSVNLAKIGSKPPTSPGVSSTVVAIEALAVHWGMGEPASPDAETRERLLDVLGELVVRDGPARFVVAPVEPGKNAFPEPWSPTRGGVSLLVRRLAVHAGLDHTIDIEDGRAEGARPTERKPATRVELTELTRTAGASPATYARYMLGFVGADDVVGTVAHEVGVAHAALSRVAHADPYRSAETPTIAIDPDVDLSRGSIATVYLGLGVLAANAAYQQYSSGGRFNGGYVPLEYDVLRAGYVPMSDLAFLVAVQAVVRGEAVPPPGLEPPQRDEVAAWIRALRGRSSELRERLGIPGDAIAGARAVAVVFEDAGDAGPDDAPVAPRNAFRWRTHRGGVGLLAGTVLGVSLAAIVASRGMAPGLAFGGAAVGHVVGRRVRVPRCSACATVVAPDATTCWKCGAALRGDIASLSERLEAEERLDGSGSAADRTQAPPLV